MSAIPEEKLAALAPSDRVEVEAFSRFLNLEIPPDEARAIRRDYPGWVPYCIGRFFGYGGRVGEHTHPPPGYDSIPFTAWTLPG